jgi:hypothetical protein
MPIIRKRNIGAEFFALSSSYSFLIAKGLLEEVTCLVQQHAVSKPVFTCRVRSPLQPPQAILKRSELVFTCRARLLLLPLPHPSRFFLRGQNQFFPAWSGRCCHCLTRQGFFFLRGQNRFSPAGRGRCYHCLTVKVNFVRGQNRFLPAGRGRCCHSLTAKVVF